MPNQQPYYLGPYELLTPLGEGGMGIVYLAKHKNNEKEVALKTLKVPEENLLRSLRREIDALASLRHPGIVRILDQGVTLKEGLPWYAMELIPGKNLQQWRISLSTDSSYSQTPSPYLSNWWTLRLPEEAKTLVLRSPNERNKETTPGSISQQITQVNPSGDSIFSQQNALYPSIEKKRLGEVLEVVSQLCISLAYLHGKGIIHRDLKPENILIREKGRTTEREPVLVDFGLASLWGSLGEDSRERFGNNTLESAPIGTPFYMSPEQIKGQTLDARSDLYALGVLLYELLCGRLPFEGKTLEATLLAHLFDAPPKPSKWVPHLSEELEALILSLLAKEKQERPGYAEDVARTLSSLSPAISNVAWPSTRPYLYRPRFVGRKALLTCLKEHLERWEAGQGGLVFLGGESGVGKTRLIMELVKESKQTKKSQVWIGECEDSKILSPLRAFRKVLEAIEDRCRAKGKEETERILGKRGPLLAQYRPSLSSLPGQEEFPSPHDLPFKEARLRLFFALSETLTAFSSPTPFVLILDDLQWADELSLGFLQFLLKGGPLGRKLLILGTYRSQEVGKDLEPLLTDPRAFVYPVPRLEENAVAEMLGDMLALPVVPEKLSRFLSEQSEGNPFFVTEYLRTAVEEGLLFRDETGKWQVKEKFHKENEVLDYQGLGLPRSLKDLVARWLDGLSSSAREWLFAAAVLGKESPLFILEEVGPKELRGLHELLAREVLEESRVGFVKFSHDKLREGALAQIPMEIKPQFHRKVAKVLEPIEGTPEGILGYHWEQAGESRQARAYYLKGARKASKNYIHQQAETLYRSYLSLVTTPTQESIEARNELGEKVLQVQGKMEAAAKEYTKALEEAQQIGDRDAEGQILRLLGIIFWRLGQIEESRRFYEQALAIFQERNNFLMEGRNLASLGSLYQSQGIFETSQEYYKQALKLHREVEDRSAEGQTLGNIATLYKDQGFYKEANEYHKQSLLIHREVGNRRSESITVGNLAIVHFMLGRYQEAEDGFEQALAISREVGDRFFEGLHLGNLADFYQKQGRYQEAQRFSEQAIAICHELGNQRVKGILLGNLASLHDKQGNHEETQKLYTQALDLIRLVKDRRLEGVFLRKIGDIERRYRGNLPKAEKLFSQANPLLSETPIERGQLFCSQGYLALAAKKSAAPFLSKAKTIAQELEISEENELRQRIVRLSSAQEAFEAKKFSLLFRGELWKDIPASLQRWLKENGQLSQNAY